MQDNHAPVSQSSLLSHAQRLVELRDELARRKLDGFIVPLTDEHMSECVGAYAQRLAWLTGFGGSAGTAVVLTSEAAIFVDGRYTLQVRQQVDERHWRCESALQTSVGAWLGVHAPVHAQIGYDPWLHTTAWVAGVRAALKGRNAQLVEVATNPVDAVWCDQPALPAGKLIVYPDSLAGKSSAEKRHQVAAWLCTKQADAVVLSALDSIAWVLNVRGQDVDHTPVALAYAVVHRDGSTDLFVSRDKLTDAVIAHLGDVVRHHSREAFESYLGTLAGKRVAVDPDRTVAAVFQALESAGALAIEVRDPVVLPKAIKNALEIAGHKAAQLRDCAALCRFLAWLAAEAPSGALTELSAAARLREFREATGALRDLSFDTISSFGPNGAIVHYHPTEATCRQLRAGSLYLLDSGGQYIDGTTDVTRTISIGTPSQEMRQCFTRVLKGHIALARAVFPAGTNGGQLDVLARQHLWSAGLDYPHGTGHGVGAYLGVHEGPQRISRTGDCSEPLVPGMIVSIEPGYYKPGHYGIRIENLALIVECDVTGAEQPMLGFEALTFAPFDRALIDLTLLTMDERAWINTYHHNVARIVAPQLEGAAKEWLSDATRLLD